jgi:glycine/D-amino acid oxidase-like deaminating enzyme
MAVACNDLPAVATDAAQDEAGVSDERARAVLIGRARASSRLACSGHGMLGISMSAGTGQRIADLVCGRTPAIDPAPYRPERFR